MLMKARVSNRFGQWQQIGSLQCLITFLSVLALMCCILASPSFAQYGGDRPFHNQSRFLGTETVTVALVQLPSAEVGDWDDIQLFVQEASNKGADFVVFPESSYLGWLNPAVFEQAVPIPGDVTQQLGRIASDFNVWIAFGTSEQGPSAGDGVYYPYDSGVIISPNGDIALHARKHNVLENSFTPSDCPPEVQNPGGGCNYLAAPVDNLGVVETPLGTTAILVCADAYTYDTAALDRVKSLGAEAIIVVWGVTAGQKDQCGSDGFNATTYAQSAATYTGALVIGANAVGNRPYGRYQPSVYCGYSGISAPDGAIIGETETDGGVFVYEVPVSN